MEKCEDVIVRWQAYKADGTRIDPDQWTHDMTGAGYTDEPAGKKLQLANPWGPSHSGSDSPENKSFFDDIDITIVNGKMRSTDRDILDRIDAKLNAAYVEIDDVFTISPAQKTTKVKDGKNPKPGGTAEYWYEITNEDSDSIWQFAAEVRVPFDPATVLSPLGWDSELLYPDLAPDLFPAPGTDLGTTWEAGWTGIRWFTSSSPISAGQSLGGFAFLYEDLPVYGTSEYACVAALGRTGGSSVDYLLVSGPYVIPDAPTIVAIWVGISVLTAYIRRRRMTEG